MITQGAIMPTKEATTAIYRQPHIIKCSSTYGNTFGHPIFSAFNFVNGDFIYFFETVHIKPCAGGGFRL
jgi:hypothetical protein